ncbi:PilN domain-containing protein [Chryseomicrobium sp. FSL W7-1435]|uniref:PilN domain-containing protein n=1 Tax=Chryseomicrobium sp. FSL W7-1435 TaxID=2921704 RepID=UPI003159F012
MNPEINLLPVFEKRKPESFLGLILFIVVLGALIVFLAIYLMGIKQDAADLAAEEQNLIAQRTALQQQVTSTDPEPEITYADAVLFVETNSYPVSPLYEEIQNLADANTYVRNYSFSPEAITLAVDFETKSEIAFFVENLMKSNYFANVQVDSILEFEPLSTTEEPEGIVEEEQVAPRYTASIRITPLPEFVAQGVTQP